MGTKTRTWGISAPASKTNAGSVTTTTSPRDATGKLLMRSNEHRKYSTDQAYIYDANWVSWYGALSDSWYYGVTTTRLRERCSIAYGRAYSSFRKQAYQQAEMMLAVDIAERKKTYAMIGKAFQRILAFARAVKHADPRAIARALSSSGVSARQIRRDLYRKRRPRKGKRRPVDFANAWMEYRYGWMPLLRSVYDGCELLSQQRKVPDFCSGVGKDVFAAYNVDAFNSSYKRCWTTANLRVTLKGRIIINNPDLYRLNQYGLLNPLSVAWELVPFSFVIDWFVKVGDYLNSLTDWAGMSFSDLSITYSAKGTSSCHSYGGAGNPFGTQAGLKFVTSKGVTKVRDIVASPPVPELKRGSGYQVRAERWTAEQRAVDTIAMFTQQMSKRH